METTQFQPFHCEIKLIMHEIDQERKLLKRDSSCQLFQYWKMRLIIDFGRTKMQACQTSRKLKEALVAKSRITGKHRVFYFFILIMNHDCNFSCLMRCITLFILLIFTFDIFTFQYPQ